MKTLLVNADDFGLHADIDRGVLACIDAGVVQSISVSPQGRSVDWASIADLQRRGVKVGLHLTLVGEPWGSDGRVVEKWPALVKAVTLGGGGMRAAVDREADWQIGQFLAHGIRPDHIDSHQHVHVFAGLWPVVRRLQREHGIPRIRVPRCASWRIIKRNLPGVALQTLSTQRAMSIDGYLPCLGIAEAGHNTATVLCRELEVAAARQSADLECVMHPGVNTPDLEATYAAWRFDWTGERDALLDPTFRATMDRLGYGFAPITPRPPTA